MKAELDQWNEGLDILESQATQQASVGNKTGGGSPPLQKVIQLGISA